MCDQPCHTVDQRGRFAGAGAGDHQQRAVAVDNRLALLGIQPGQEAVDCGRRVHDCPDEVGER